MGAKKDVEVKFWGVQLNPYLQQSHFDSLK